MVTYIKGDLLKSDCNMIVQQTNCMGIMSAGLALKIRNKYPETYGAYKSLCDYTENARDLMGKVLYVRTNDDHVIADMFSQENYGTDRVYTEYDSFKNACKMIAERCLSTGAAVGFPYGIGCGLAGGDWDTIKQIIEEEFGNSEIDCRIYDNRRI